MAVIKQRDATKLPEAARRAAVTADSGGEARWHPLLSCGISQSFQKSDPVSTQIDSQRPKSYAARQRCMRLGHVLASAGIAAACRESQLPPAVAALHSLVAGSHDAGG